MEAVEGDRKWQQESDDRGPGFRGTQGSNWQNQGGSGELIDRGGGPLTLEIAGVSLCQSVYNAAPSTMTFEGFRQTLPIFFLCVRDHEVQIEFVSGSNRLTTFSRTFRKYLGFFCFFVFFCVKNQNMTLRVCLHRQPFCVRGYLAYFSIFAHAFGNKCDTSGNN